MSTQHQNWTQLERSAKVSRKQPKSASLAKRAVDPTSNEKARVEVVADRLEDLGVGAAPEFVLERLDAGGKPTWAVNLDLADDHVRFSSDFLLIARQHQGVNASGSRYTCHPLVGLRLSPTFTMLSNFIERSENM